MSVPRTKPVYLAGTPRSSGDVQTGEVTVTRGGGRVFTAYSGLANDTVIYSGAGRLANILVIGQAPSSGGQVAFCDTASITSGFPIAGQKVIGVIPTIFQAPVTQSGSSNPFALPGTLMVMDMPFQSGLAAIGYRSGGPGFSVSYTPEANLDMGGPFTGA